MTTQNPKAHWGAARRAVCMAALAGSGIAVSVFAGAGHGLLNDRAASSTRPIQAGAGMTCPTAGGGVLVLSGPAAGPPSVEPAGTYASGPSGLTACHLATTAASRPGHAPEDDGSGQRL
jgi:hypothetical protein